MIENIDLVLQLAEQVSGLCQRLGLVSVFKDSFDKANRGSGKSFRGPGPQEGLAILKEVLQIPAVLCRQTNLLEAAVAGFGSRSGQQLRVQLAGGGLPQPAPAATPGLPGDLRCHPCDAANGRSGR